LTVTELIRNDKLFDLDFTVTDSDGVAVDLTGSLIRFKMALQGASTSKVSSTSVSITTATSGTCSYTVQSGDLDTSGLYNAELQIVYSTTTTAAKTITATLDNIRVVDDLP